MRYVNYLQTAKTNFNMWQKERAGKFTASEIYKLFVEPKTIKSREAGAWSDTAETYIFEKAVETATGYRKEFTNSALNHGIVNEFEGYDAFVKLTGFNFQLTSTQFFPLNDYAGASPDAVLFDDNDFSKINAVMDVKCPYNPVSFYEQKDAFLKNNNFQGVPKPYFYQLQMQMMSTGCNTGYLVRYLTSSITDDYGNKHEFDLPLESRIFWTKIKFDEQVAEQILYKIEAAEKYKQSIIENLIHAKVNPVTQIID